jgi:hypothetical protein
MNAGDLFEVNRFITEKVKWFDEEFPEDVAEPIIEKLLNFGGLVIRRLDPLVREAYADNPEKLAQWEAVLRGPADPEGEGDGPVDIESSQVS